MCALRIALRILLLPVCLSSCWVYAQSTSPKSFMDGANKAFNEKNLVMLKPEFGTVMKPLTGVQSASQLRDYLKQKSLQNAEFGELKLHSIAQDKSLHSLQLVSFDVDAITSAAFSDAPVKLCGGDAPYCALLKPSAWKKVSGNVERLVATLGAKSAGKPGGQAVFIRDGDEIYGALNAGRQNYLLRQVAGGVFAITLAKVDGQERNREDVMDMKKISEGPLAKGVSSGAAKAPGKATPTGANIRVEDCPNPSTPSELELTVMVTPRAKAEAVAAGHNIRQLIRTAENISNVSFQNSQINGAVNVVDISDIAYQETGNFDKDIKELLKENGALQALRQARRAKKTDVGVLVIDDPDPKNCGIAAGIGVTKDKAFVVVNWRCLTDKFSFIHEVGHLAGAWHDPAALGEGYDVQPPYAYGYVTTGNDPVATIMAYRESCSKPCGRIWNWSNPYTKTEDGQILGTKEKNFDACVWRRRLPEMAKFDGG